MRQEAADDYHGICLQRMTKITKEIRKVCVLTRIPTEQVARVR